MDRQLIADVHRLPHETLDRVNRTGASELIAVDGAVRGVLPSPANYETLTFDDEFAEVDVALVGRSVRQARDGFGRPSHELLETLPE